MVPLEYLVISDVTYVEVVLFGTVGVIVSDATGVPVVVGNKQTRTDRVISLYFTCHRHRLCVTRWLWCDTFWLIVAMSFAITHVFATHRAEYSPVLTCFMKHL